MPYLQSGKNMFGLHTARNYLSNSLSDNWLDLLLRTLVRNTLKSFEAVDRVVGNA